MRKAVLFVMAILLSFGACGCMNNKDAGDAESYLSEKYNGNFAYISRGDDVWSSKSKSYIFSDTSGNEFTVKENSGYYTDNYCSALFDKQAAENIRDKLTIDAKIFINTESAFFGSSKQFCNLNDYLKECAVVNVVIYTTQNDSYDAITIELLDLLENCSAFVVIHHVSSDVYSSITRYEDSKNVLSSESFLIENNEISSKTWEE